MKKIALIFGIMIVGIIALLETSSTSRSRDNSQYGRIDPDDIWWGN